MKISISHVKHKNVNALLMESDLLAITIIPASGGKIQSISSSRKGLDMVYLVLAKETKSHAQAHKRGYSNNSI